MTLGVTAHLRPQVPIEVRRAENGTQWISFGEPGSADIGLFADDDQLTRLRDVIDEHLGGAA